MSRTPLTPPGRLVRGPCRLAGSLEQILVVHSEAPPLITSFIIEGSFPLIGFDAPLALPQFPSLSAHP